METLEKIIKEFLESDLQELDVPMCPIEDYVKTFEQFDWDCEHDLETGEWEIDFSLNFTKRFHRIMLTGSLYHGCYKLEKRFV